VTGARLARALTGALCWLVLAAPARAQDALTPGAALDEAVYFNPELIALRRQPSADPLAVLVRANDILADVRRAYAELTIAREGLEIADGYAPALREMAKAATVRYASGESGQAESPIVLVELARLAIRRSTWQERVRLGEVRLNALLGRRLDQPIEPLAERNLSATPADSEQVALGRHPLLAIADAEIARQEAGAPREAAQARREVVAAGIRRRVREARIRIDAARERVLLTGDTVLPQLQQAFDAAQVAYATSRGTLSEMLDRHHRLLDARTEYADAYAEFDRALVDLAVATGEDPQRLAPAVRPREGAK
jgi:cobalt-zinc-cadmium efflux system outer membrane protein